ncbi:thiol reductant ABC exporter subunit CydC [Candidatus Formimonas warabiya]|uniref:Thiol reductant ABC exporter subunit CydC n=1 Tax=Formimonas warabiya TaxID=1761012 RepID=A0A3G1KVP1_FORW1|nr:thiol reductant ABC exporter subunit CydC [Candidatus Formimonas warabiya]ATW26534.1 thiol reductant ABC exporter subunit CydC [Candidatus Formimonas warabiya]
MKDLARLLHLIAPYGKGMTGAALFSFCTVASNVGLLAASALLISRAALHPPVLDLMVLIVAVRFFGISRAVFRYAERYFSHDITFRILQKIRVWFYAAVEPLAPANLMGYRSGELLNRIVADVETLKEFYLRVLAPPLTAFFVLVATFAFVAWFDVKFGLVLVISFLGAGVVVPLLIKRLSRGVKKEAGEIRSALHAHLVDSIQGMREIAAFGQEEKHLKDTAQLGRTLVKLEGKTAGFSGISHGASLFVMNLSLWVVLVLAIPLVHSGRLDGTYLAMVALSILASFEAVLPLPFIYPHLEESLAAAGRLFQVIDTKPAGDPFSGSSLPPRDYSLQVENLRFRYTPEQPWVLDGLSFELPQGGRIAISGPSGAGKSTLVNLLLGFWDYQEGSIKLGGRELKDYRQEDLLRCYGVVTQQTHLFNTTVRENLALARPSAREEEMIRAAREARIHEFILTLPQGYETYIGEGGFKLSGGQRQRLAIARALLKDAPVLLLDEPTANLDAVTEQEVMEALYRLMEGKTVLMITHRPEILEKIDIYSSI